MLREYTCESVKRVCSTIPESRLQCKCPLQICRHFQHQAKSRTWFLFLRAADRYMSCDMKVLLELTTEEMKDLPRTYRRRKFTLSAFQPAYDVDLQSA